jgi:hypothetical protein
LAETGDGPDDERAFRRVHRIVIGAVLGWSLAVVFLAWIRGYDLEHGLTEALVPCGFGITAAWSWPDRWQRIGLATAGLGAAHAETLHLLEGSLGGHALFFVLSLLLAAYRRPIAMAFLAVYVAALHIGFAAVDAHAVYGHDDSPTRRLALIVGQTVWLGFLTLAIRLRRPRPTRV